MLKSIPWKTVASAGFVAAFGCLTLIGAPLVVQSATAQPAGAVSPAQDSNVPGVSAEIIECKRKDNVLSIRMRFHNTSDAPVKFRAIAETNYDKYYVTAANKKYLVLRDTDKTPLAVAVNDGSSVSISLPKNGSYTWWAKYPAPPPEQKSITYYTPLTPPFEDVPISD
jgi:hypothetical protein